MKNKKLFAILTLVCFMFTLMPVAAFAFDEQKSYVGVQEKNVEVGDDVTIELDLDATTDSLYIWFEEKGYDNVIVKAVALDSAPAGYSITDGLIFTNAAGQYDEIEVEFDRDGEFVVHAAVADPIANEFAAAIELRPLGNVTVTVDPTEEDSDEYYLNIVSPVDSDPDDDIVEIELVDADPDGNIAHKETATLVLPEADGAYVQTVELKLFDKNNEAISSLDVEIDAASALNVTDVKLHRSGKVVFDVTADRVGTHKITITVGDYKAYIKVVVTESVADEIELVDAPKTPINLDDVDDAYATLFGRVEFAIYDKNGNELNDSAAGIDGAQNSWGAATNPNRNYVAVTEKPANSDLASKDVKLGYNAAYGWSIMTLNGFDEEGKYTFKVTLDNGEFATVSVNVKEAGEPASLSISYDADSVQLGATISPKAIVWLDKNYVSTSAYADVDADPDVVDMELDSSLEFVVTGAAVESVGATDDDCVIKVKDDEKYIGSEITVAVVDEDNNLIATKTLTVAAEAKELVFDKDAVDANFTNTINVSLVDEDGKSVALTGVTTTEAYVIVLDKPADADVTVGDVKTLTAKKGVFSFAFSSDTVGTVKLQAVLKATVAGTNEVVRYYTGTQEIKVGATGMDDVVVMSIGSDQIIINNEVKKMPCEAVIKDGRTMVPFRAGLEALGATVEYDQATESVIAELDGTKVVMTLGEKAYTVNGVAKVADVAPYLNVEASTTMVPASFVANEFGINVDYTTNPDGTVADVLFAN